MGDYKEKSMPNTDPQLAKLTVIARQVGLSTAIIEHCLEVDLIRQPLSSDDLAELRRIRRLRMLGVNLSGVEIILRMRRRLQVMQVEMETMAAEMAERQARLEQELREMERRLARDL
jgi:hypothetical protein